MKAIYMLVLVSLLSACTKDFDKINTDPNTATDVSPQYLLSTALVNIAYAYQDDAFMGKPAEAGRYITKVRNEGDDLFGWSAENWDGYYQSLSVNEQLYDLAVQSGMKQYMGVSRVIRAFNFAYITDLYGDCPYSEALHSKDSGIIHPKYDQQQNIYADLLKTLTAANDSLANTNLAINATYDVMFGGSRLKWRKFANALHLRLLLRISSHDATAFAAMQTMLSDPARYPLFESNSDNAEVKYLGVTSSDSWQGGNLVSKVTEVNKYKPSKEIVDTLLALNDPRLAVWVAPVASATGYTVDPNTYVGVPNAIPSPYNYNGGEAHISELSAIFYQNANPLLKASLMTYAEQCFILAEAVQRGAVTVTGETAATLYNKGISASLSYNGVNSTDQATYLSQPAVIYKGTLSQLITQKWISLFLKGPEGWFDHRRTGYPAFVPGPLSAIRTIPARFIYPTTEQSYNLTEYKAAIARQGADQTTTLMWYLK
jgi:hypothetical protein